MPDIKPEDWITTVHRGYEIQGFVVDVEHDAPYRIKIHVTRSENRFVNVGEQLYVRRQVIQEHIPASSVDPAPCLDNIDTLIDLALDTLDNEWFQALRAKKEAMLRK